MEVHITSAEVELLSRILESRSRDLEHQIRHADHHDFKQLLQREQVLVTGLLDKLGTLEPAAATSDVLLSST